jgi:ubiquitin carboxyl-terminal hydrolase 2/21
VYSCFLNSTLQNLFSTPGLLPYFASGRYEEDINVRAARTKGSLARAFGALASRMVSLSDHSAERPTMIKSAVSMIDTKFAGYGQHDSHEFMRVLLSALHDDCNRISIQPAYEEIKDGDNDSTLVKSNRWWRNYCERNDSIVTDCFAGQLQSTLVCQTCMNESEAFDPFMDLSLPIPKSSTPTSGGGGVFSRLSPFSTPPPSSSAATAKCSIADCFAEFVREEMLSGNEQVYCRICKSHRNQTKKLRVYIWPRILVLHLKRFSYGQRSRTKLSTDVEFTTELDCGEMSRKSAEQSSTKSPNKGSATQRHLAEQEESQRDPPPIYDLYGISNHSGSTSGGHYTVSKRTRERGRVIVDAARVDMGCNAGVLTFAFVYRRRAHALSLSLLLRRTRR